jgi:hypothetical protein
MFKKGTFSDMLHKVKTYCFANYYHFPFELPKKYKIVLQGV